MPLIVAGSDDMNIYVIDMISHEVLKSFQAHDDFIRSIDVHSSLPFILT
jgi:coatomer subunit beta'